MVRRRVACIVFVAFVVGCSYDWNIGTGSTAGGPAPSGGSSGSSGSSGTSGNVPVPDSGARETGAPAQNGECGPSCECRNNQTCEFTCAQGPCELKCTGSSRCTLTCAEGALCGVACEDKADCNLDCKNARSQCSLTCDDDANCKADCGIGTLCTRDCSRDCNVNCAPGALCPP